VVQPVQEVGGEPAALKERGKFRPRRGEQFVDQPLRERLGGVPEDELLALLLVVGDEGDDAD
jgi:hypothetical protein